MSNGPDRQLRIGSAMQLLDRIERTARTVGRIPTGPRLGLLIIGLGVVADLIAHLDPGLDRDPAQMTAPQFSAHLVVFLGMVLVLVSVVIGGARSSRRSRGA